MNNKVLAFKDSRQQNFPSFDLAELKALQRNMGLGEVLWSVREKSWQYLQKASVPHYSAEAWRYTKPELFAWPELALMTPFKLAVSLADQKEISNERGLSFLTQESELKEHEPWLNTLLDPERLEYSELLHQVSFSAFGLLVARRNSRIEQSVFLSALFESTQKVLPSLLVVKVESGASLTLIEDLPSGSAAFYFPQIVFVVEQGAQLNFLSLQRLCAQSTYLARHRFDLKHDARLESVHLALGAKASRLDLDCELSQSGASASLWGLCVADSNRHVDFHPSQKHLAAHTKSELLYKGVLKDRAHSVYFGFIEVSEGAQKTDAYQANRNLLLSSEARADSIPNLAIRANDVRCSHGSSVGQLGRDELFYLMSRGLSQEAAEKLLMEGFFADLLARISNRTLAEYAANRIFGSVI